MTLDEALDYRTAFRQHKERCRQLIVESGYRSICEVGGGRKPLFTESEVEEMGLSYTVLDISPQELTLAPAWCHRVAGDVCDLAALGQESAFDFVFSKMLAEHVRSGEAMHRSILGALRPGGRAFHFFPTLFATPFLANRLLPARLSHRIVHAIFRGSLGYARFPAVYSKCYGPTPGMTSFLTGLGYEIDEFRSFYGHGYLDRFPVIRDVDRTITRWGALRSNPYMTSYAYLVLHKPVTGVRDPV